MYFHFPAKFFSSFIIQVKEVVISFGKDFIDENTFSGKFLEDSIC